MFTLEDLMTAFREQLYKNDCLVSDSIIDCEIVDVEHSLKLAWESLHEKK